MLLSNPVSQQVSDVLCVSKPDMHTNNIPGSWSTSREFRIFDIPLRLH